MMSVRCLSRLVCPLVAHNLPKANCGAFLQHQGISSSSDYVQMSMNDKTGVATMRLKREPSNSFSLEMLTELVIQIERLEVDRSCQGLFITSAIPGVFSSGLDINEIVEPEVDRLKIFWRSMQDFWLRLYGSPLITIALINGDAHAGGCAAALACDFRIMAESNSYTIGLNESRAGIIAPPWLQEAYSATIGYRQSELGVQLGTLFSCQEALKLGLVDKLVAEPDLVTAGEEEMEKWLEIPAAARQLTKRTMRFRAMEWLHNTFTDDVSLFVNHVTQSSTQRDIVNYLFSTTSTQKVKK